MPQFNNLNLYQVLVNGRDSASGKAVKNIWWFRPDVTGLAYGAAVVPSDMLTAVTDFRTLYRAQILTRLSVRYQVLDYTISQVVGWSGALRTLAISSAVPGVPSGTQITTMTNHGLGIGHVVTIAGLVNASAANGTRPVEALLGGNVFTVAPTAAGSDMGVGTVSAGSLRPRYQLGNAVTLVAGGAGDAGQVDEEQLPIHTTWSVRKITATAGKNFRGGLRLSCIPETAQIDGKATTGEQTARDTAMTAMLAGIDIGLGGGGSDDMALPVHVSTKLAFGQPTTFTQTATFAKYITTYINSKNMGSMTRRKPKLDAPISLV